MHMKSRVGVGSCPSKVRIEQSKDLLETVGELIDDSGERDVILIGDFNHRTDHQSFEPLTDADFIFQTRFLNQASAAGSYIKTWNPHKSEDLIDHIAIRYSDTREVVRSSTTVYQIKSKEAGKKYIMRQSDHVPVWTSFYIDSDLDDEE